MNRLITRSELTGRSDIELAALFRAASEDLAQSAPGSPARPNRKLFPKPPLSRHRPSTKPRLSKPRPSGLLRLRHRLLKLQLLKPRRLSKLRRLKRPPTKHHHSRRLRSRRTTRTRPNSKSRFWSYRISKPLPWKPPTSTAQSRLVFEVRAVASRQPASGSANMKILAVPARSYS